MPSPPLLFLQSKHNINKNGHFLKCLFKRQMSNSLLTRVERAPPDKILGLTEFFNKDKNSRKVNLTVGIYKDNNGKVTTFPSVANAQRLLDEHNEWNKNLSYLPINGNEKFSENVLNFLFRDSCGTTGDSLLKNDKISFIQTLSGTGAIAITAKFLASFISKDIWIPNLSWANHLNIFSKNGFQNINHYSYYDVKNGQLSIDTWLDSLRTHVKSLDPSNKNPQCILLHACCHNPTGLDPTREQWKQIIDTIYDLKMIPILDMAYQGLESGNLIEDAYVLRMCLAKGDWNNGLYLCQSFAKNMGLYGERVGSLSIVTPQKSSPLVKESIDSQLKQIIRSIYSSPPGYGSRVANVVLSDENLKNQWFKDVESMVNRLHSVRNKLANKLNWPEITNFKQQHGMFYFTRFTPSQVQLLRKKYSVYLTGDGRLSLSGINDSNIEYVSEAILDVSRYK